MNKELKARFKSEADRCRTIARKHNVNFNEASLADARATIERDPAHYTPIRLQIYSSGTIKPEWHR